MEYSALAKLPKTSKKRLARAALTSLGLATIYVPVLEFALTDPAAGRSPSWFAGLALWLSSLVVLAISLLIGGKISRAVHFYFLEKAAALPGLLVIFFGGIWMFRGGVSESSTTPYAFGLGAGLVVLPFAIRSRARRWGGIGGFGGRLWISGSPTCR